MRGSSLPPTGAAARSMRFERKYQGRTYESVEELCADPDIDVIWVATPNQFHCAHAVMAAEHGKHVICTKPMALTVAECEAMCLAAERNGVTAPVRPDLQHEPRRPGDVDAWHVPASSGG